MNSLPPGRRIRRLHVRASAEEDASRAATLLADAFRTASLPVADGGRQVIIRRLSLGRISTSLSPASLALHVERVTREAIADAVSWDAAAACDANAVVVGDRGEAIVALARLHARGASADEWFWPAVVPEWRRAVSSAARWALLLDAAHRLPQAAVVAAAILDEAVALGAADALSASMTPRHCVEWLRSLGWNSTRPLQERTAGAVTFAWPQAVRRWQQRWGTADERVVWLATMSAVRQQPARAADPQLPRRVAGMLAAAFDAPEVDAGKVADTPAPTSSSLDRRSGSTSPAPRGSRRSSERADELPAETSQRSPDAGQRTSTAASDRAGGEASSDRPNIGGGDVTPCAGLFFVLPILQHLGFSEYLASHPALVEAGFPARVLWFIGARAGATAGDPLAVAIAPAGGEFDWGSACTLLDLPDPARDILSRPARAITLDSPLVAWLTAVRRWSRRCARLGLVTLIRRPGRVRLSRTHADVSFALSSLDVRVRRMALDVDPGWVPWLGRVVQFHYVDDHDRSR